MSKFRIKSAPTEAPAIKLLISGAPVPLFASSACLPLNDVLSTWNKYNKSILFYGIFLYLVGHSIIQTLASGRVVAPPRGGVT